MIDMDLMEDSIAHYNFSGTIRAPHGRLAKILNQTDEMSKELEGIWELDKEKAKYLLEFNGNLDMLQNDLQSGSNTVDKILNEAENSKQKTEFFGNDWFANL